MQGANVVKLDRLHEFVTKHPDCYLPPRSAESKKLLRQYSATCRDITEPLPKRCGVYLWGYYDHCGLWKNLYLGIAGFGKTACLRSRIREELRDEKCFAWVDILGSDKILDRESGREFRKRAIKKRGATHIFWVATPELPNDTVHDLESDLIEALNPEANVSRPAPPHTRQAITGGVFVQIRKGIHQFRPKR